MSLASSCFGTPFFALFIIGDVGGSVSFLVRVFKVFVFHSLNSVLDYFGRSSPEHLPVFAFFVFVFQHRASRTRLWQKTAQPMLAA